MKKIYVTPILLSILLASCASSNDSSNTNTADADDAGSRVAVTGSHISRKASTSGTQSVSGQQQLTDLQQTLSGQQANDIQHGTGGGAGAR